MKGGFSDIGAPCWKKGFSGIGGGDLIVEE